VRPHVYILQSYEAILATQKRTFSNKRLHLIEMEKQNMPYKLRESRIGTIARPLLAFLPKSHRRAKHILFC